jgi:hypothetical protein
LEGPLARVLDSVFCPTLSFVAGIRTIRMRIRIRRCAAVGLTAPGSLSAVALDFDPLFLQPLIKILARDFVSTIVPPATIAPLATFGKAHLAAYGADRSGI